MHNFKYSKFSKFLSKIFWGKMMCTHRHTNFWKVIFEIMHFLWKIFWNFLQTLNFVRPRANIEIFFDMSNILLMPIIFFSRLFLIFKIHFSMKNTDFLILSPLSARRNFCTARQIFRIFNPHLWLSPHFFSDLYLQTFLIWTTFRWNFWIRDPYGRYL